MESAKKSSSGFLPPFQHFATQAIHVGQEPEQWSSLAVVPPISLATTFKQHAPGQHSVSEDGVGWEGGGRASLPFGPAETCDISKASPGTFRGLQSGGFSANASLEHTPSSSARICSS